MTVRRASHNLDSRASECLDTVNVIGMMVGKENVIELPFRTLEFRLHGLRFPGVNYCDGTGLAVTDKIGVIVGQARDGPHLQALVVQDRVVRIHVVGHGGSVPP